MKRAIVLLLLPLLLCTAPLSGGGFSYLYSRGGSDLVSKGSLDEVLRLRKSLQGPLIWARVAGREYVIRDNALLAEAEQACLPLRELDVRTSALETTMRPLEKREESLERLLDAITDRRSEEVRSAGEQQRVRDLEGQLRIVQAELAKLEEQQSRLEEREEDLDRVLDETMERIVRRAIAHGMANRLR